MDSVDALKPVDQTVVGIGNPRANCLQACLAMVLNMPIEECFDITDPELGDYWVEPLEQWASQRGYTMRTGIKAPTGIPYIANGPTDAREGVHGVVCINKELFHDPHPSRAGLTSTNYYMWFERPSPTPTPDRIAEARAIVASSMHDRDKSWGDLVLAGERDDCPEMRMVVAALPAVDAPFGS